MATDFYIAEQRSHNVLLGQLASLLYAPMTLLSFGTLENACASSCNLFSIVGYMYMSSKNPGKIEELRGKYKHII